MEKIYWNNEGKYQEELKRIEKLIPDLCKTDNKYMNLFLTASSIYYDVYNNGSCNIKYSYMEDIEKYLLPFEYDFRMSFIGSADKVAKRFSNKKTLENFMNRVIEIVKDRDLNYTQYIIYQDYDNKQLSKEPKEGFTKIVFGEKDYYDMWVRQRLNYLWGFKMV